jgi:DNA transformation protein
MGNNYFNFILDQLADFEGLTFKKMFGAITFYLDDVMIGAVIGGRFRLRMPGCTQHICGEIHSARYFEEIIQDDTLFCEVPDEIIQNKENLKDWVRQSYEIARQELQA